MSDFNQYDNASKVRRMASEISDIRDALIADGRVHHDKDGPTVCSKIEDASDLLAVIAARLEKLNLEL